MLTAVARLFVEGQQVNWAAMLHGGRRVALPTYPFQRRRYWLEQRSSNSSHYGVSWRPIADGRAELSGKWLIVGGKTRLPGVHVEIPDGADRHAIAALLPTDVTGVLSLLTELNATVALVQALGDAGIEAPLWFATTGAVAALPSDDPPDPTQAMLWGLGRTVALEYPHRWGGLVDLPPDLTDRVIERLCAVLGGREDQVAVRSSGVLARRLVRRVGTKKWQPRGTVLVTGGTGALGGHVARWLVDRGAEVVLVGRRDTHVEHGTFVACDVTDRAALAAVIDAIPDLTAVVHAAGVLADGVIESLTPQQIETVVRTKAVSAQYLHELTADRDLDAFVLFSSFAGTFGAPGQANYAAANAYLDALAECRRAVGLPATAIAWGPWADGGMAAGVDHLGRTGLVPLRPESAVDALDLDESAVVADIDWPTFAPAFTAHRPSPLISELPEARALDLTTAPTTALRDKLSGLSAAECDRVLLDVVRGQVAHALGYRSADDVEPDRAFKDLGFDSLTAVELRNRLDTATGLHLPATLAFDYPTSAALTTYLRTALIGAVEPVTVSTGTATDEPIAIVGMGCRFPGGISNPDELWDMLAAGRDAITGFPTERGWHTDTLYDPDPDHEGTTYVTEGGFLRDAGRFDAEFFGISPREALAMDPQQRLLLETSWEAVERSGIDPMSLRGKQVGVFAGTNGQDYTAALHQAGQGVDGYLATGSAGSVLSGRVSYTLGLEGPAMTVDTACSSSLVALHLAAQALRAGECTLAFAGGVTVMSTPGLFVEFSRQRGLAADGRCKAFSDSADGTGWGEGAGVVVLERLSDALRNGRSVLAVVRGSAVNQDGASNGLTAPNGPAQQRVIRAALANAGLAPSDVDAVEAHGTGTTLGDPIEAQALLAAYGRDRDRPLWLGSIKSNIGHTQAASGVAGVIKMVLALRHETLPPTLNVTEPSSHVDWSSGAVRLLTDPVAWQANGRRRAGVSSFGVSGTNAHVVIEEAPPAEVMPPAEARSVAWVLSGRTETAVRSQAARLLSTATDLAPVDVAWSLACTRSAFEHRASVVGGSREELLAGLSALAAGEQHAAVVHGSAVSGRTVFVFPGQGAQWAGMGVELLDSSPVFAARMAECADAFAPFVDWSLPDELHGPLDQVDVVQPASWAVMVSLAALWRSHGVEPDAVVGHSQGEIAAAVVAGALSLADGARVVALRSKAIARCLAGNGGMVSLALPVDAVRERLTDGISVAAVNGPSSVVVSGDPDALDELVAACTADGIRCRRIPVDYASHSTQVEAIRAELLDVLAPIHPKPAEIPFCSTVTGDVIDTSTLDAGYWFRNLRETVEFERAIRLLARDGSRRFVEVSSHPVLTIGIQETLDGNGIAVGTLRRDDGGPTRFTASLGEWWVHGGRVDWDATYPGGRRVALPTYAFQGDHYWPHGSGTTRPPDAGDDEFWAAVEREDLASIADTLAVEQEPLGTVLPALATWRRQRREQSTIDELRYRISWQQVPDSTSTLSGTWLVLVPDGIEHPWIDGAIEAIRAAGAEVVTKADGPVAGVLSLLALDETHGLVNTFHTVQAGIDAPLWLATSGAVSTGRGDSLTSPTQAQVWGLGRVVGLEHADRWGGLVDLPDTVDPVAAQRLVSALAGIADEDQLAIRGNGILARRLVHAPIGDRRPSRTWQPTGTILITGGTGALGAHVARWLATAGADDLILTSRRGPDAPGAAQLVDELATLGATATVVACDVADRAALAKVLTGEPIRAVVHTAGVVQATMLADMDAAELADVLSAKVDGARNLDELLDDDLDAFVLFSSNAGVWGSG
ncbi:MAG TPA: SDR family NAD(P)-dependent oxidoreductase, partial [Pseudonocardiaceae bacterium]|nr:SDR family NAD(P)-dependent oxidoreductase [Pseudonocardiaceae bacterium]